MFVPEIVNDVEPIEPRVNAWWCKSCGTWELLDDADVCRPCRADFLGALAAMRRYHEAEAEHAAEAAYDANAWGEPNHSQRADLQFHSSMAASLDELAWCGQ